MPALADWCRLEAVVSFRGAQGAGNLSVAASGFLELLESAGFAAARHLSILNSQFSILDVI
jgi:hypothetical protein